MKRAILFFAIVLTSLSSANAQWWNSEKVKGNGELVTKTRNTSSYDGVELVGSLNVELVSGAEGKIRVEAESNLQEYILTEVKNGTLKVSTEKNVDLRPTKKIRIIVPFESISKVALTGSGDISTSDIIKSQNFEMQVTGSGDMKLNISTGKAEGQITGSGNIYVSGQTEDFTCKVTGSGDFKAYELRAENARASISGSGDIEVYTVNSLYANVAGSGDVTYKGNPKKQDFKTSGSGSVASH